MALLHLLYELVERRYVPGWRELARELQRVGRLEPGFYPKGEGGRARQDAESALQGLQWIKVLDFCERLYHHLAQEVTEPDGNWDTVVVAARSDVQAFIDAEVQRIFVEEALAYEFLEGVVRRRGRRHTVDLVARADVVLGDPRLSNARKHYEKATRFFRHPSKPDYENAVKEAVCTVESAGKALFPEAKAATLGELVKWLSSHQEIKLPKALASTISGLYGYRSGGDGVGHGGTTGGPATAAVAEYVLAAAASQVIYLVDLANAQEVDIPF
jgi:hypothetical protein